MAKLILKIEYDGTVYCGWQRQKNALSVQEVLENALSSLAGMKLNIIGAGRTDAGVHAKGQVAHCNLNNVFPVPVDKIVIAVNSILPDDIRIKKAILTELPFHATKNALAREYSYTIRMKENVFERHYSHFIRFNPDFELLNKSAAVFLGNKNFTPFSKVNSETKDYNCHVYSSSWISENKISEKFEDISYKYTIKANRFVYGMVRSIVGAMLDVARGKKTIAHLEDAFYTNNRNYISPLAPACGLILEKVHYSEEIEKLLT